VTGSVRHLVTREQIQAGLQVTNWGSLAAPIVAEHALLLTLAAARNLSNWPRQGSESVSGLGHFETRTLFRKKIGIFGFGAIARALVDLLRPFQVEISVYSEGVPPDLIRLHHATPLATLPALFKSTEIVICCEALTTRTEGRIDSHLLNLLPLRAIFVNIGRGAIVREDDLAIAVQDRGLRVASDVFIKEPLAADSPFWNLRNVLISPHIGGPTDDACPECGRWAQENVARFTQSLPPIGLITPDVFDRST
jgi:phosphoglycerate dehydrogenase-like enzyme